ncbi:MAG TPA: DPP IV N-terminal domain-containing protein [Gemmatimonadales bacterium]|jgi:TolB protein
MKRIRFAGAMISLAACAPKPSGLPPVTFISSDSADQVLARFSPDGSRIDWWEPSGQVQQLWTSDSGMRHPMKVPVTSLSLVPPLWSPDGSRVAAASSDGGLLQVAVVSATGGAPEQLTDKSGAAVPVMWNRDGDRLLYAATTGVGGGAFQAFIVSSSHHTTAPLVPGETHSYIGYWSPDGTRIAYFVEDGGKSTIWVADSAGRNPRQLTADGFESFALQADQVWSPDSKEIAYESRRTGTSDIWIVGADGGAPRQLTRDVRNDTRPLWSPDGKWIAFESDRGRQNDLWVVPVAGGPEIRVTDDPDEESILQWFPNSHKLVYTTGQGESGIWAMSLADSTERRLTPDSIRATQLQLSPDGKEVAFRIDRGGNMSDLAVIPVVGSAMRTLVQGGSNSEMAWSPDGAHLAFISDRNGTPDLWVVDLAGGAPRQLDNWPGSEQNPVWSGDGKSIYFASDHDSRVDDAWKVSIAGGEPQRITQSGNVNNLTGRTGRSEILATIVDANGRFAPMVVKDNGTFSPIWKRNNAFAVDPLPGDSAIVAQNGTGGFAFYAVPMGSDRDATPLLNPADNFAFISDDGSKVLYLMLSGATRDLGILDRTTGVRRQLTHTGADEGAAALTPDEKTVVFVRSRPIRRTAIADLTTLLSGAAKQ